MEWFKDAFSGSDGRSLQINYWYWLYWQPAPMETLLPQPWFRLPSILEDSLKKKPPSASIQPNPRDSIFASASKALQSGSGVQAKRGSTSLSWSLGKRFAFESRRTDSCGRCGFERGIEDRCCGDDGGVGSTDSCRAGSEILPVHKNMQGELFIEVTSLGADSALGQIVGLMEEAQLGKPRGVAAFGRVAPCVCTRGDRWQRRYSYAGRFGSRHCHVDCLFPSSPDAGSFVNIGISKGASILYLYQRMRQSFKPCGPSVPSSLTKQVCTHCEGKRINIVPNRGLTNPYSSICCTVCVTPSSSVSSDRPLVFRRRLA